MRIGEAARQSGMPAKTIRFYESIGLIRRAERRDNGYRRYTAEDVRLLEFIHRSRSLGFTIREISLLLSLWEEGAERSADAESVAHDHLRRIDEKVQELDAIREVIVERLRSDPQARPAAMATPGINRPARAASTGATT